MKLSLTWMNSVVLNLLLWIALTPLFLLLFIGWFWRILIGVIVKLCRSDLIPCSANDVLFVRETTAVMPITNGGLIIRVKGFINYDQFVRHFHQQFLLNLDSCDTISPQNKYVNLHCDLVTFCGYLFKRIVSQHGAVNVRKHFDQQHIREEDLNTFLGRWFQVPFEKKKPLWNGVVVYLDSKKGMMSEEGGDTVIAFKASHALVDGYSLVHMLEKMTTSGSRKLGVVLGREREPKSNSKKKIHFYENFWNEAKLLFSVPLVSVKFLLKDFWVKDSIPPTKLLTKVEMLPMALGTLSLSTLKTIRRKLNVKFPSIVYALQVGALRRLLLERLEERELDEHVFLTTSLPVPNHPKDRLTNHWSGGKIKIPLRTPDAKDRVLGANESLQSVLDNNGPLIAWKYLSLLIWITPARLSYWMSFSNVSLFRYRTSMSCIPQSPEQYSLLGKPVTHVYHIPMIKDSVPQAVMLGCSSSHNDQVDFSLFGHPELVSSQESMEQVMREYFHEEFDQLVASVAKETEDICEEYGDVSAC